MVGMDLFLTLITGRTLEQGRYSHAGKRSEAYEKEIRTIQLSKETIEKLGVKEGENVRIKSRYGSVTLGCKEANLPANLAFLPYGHPANRLISSDTQCTGIPTFKGIEIKVSREKK